MKPGSRSLRILMRRVQGGIVLILEGSLDYESSSIIAQEIKALIDEDCHQACLDLRKIDFISSSGVAALVRVKRLLEDRGGRLILSSLSEEVRMVFDLTRVANYFKIFDDEASAIASMASPAGSE